MLRLLVLSVVMTSLLVVTSAAKRKDEGKPKLAQNVTMEVEMEIEVKNYNGDGDDMNGVLRIGLFGETVPASTLNFKALCAGFKRRTDKIGYKNTYCHKTVKDMLLQCGDVFNHHGRGSTSIYGESFNDENFEVSHSSGGIVSYANRGKNSNGSQFFFTMGPSRFLDKKHVAFGKVLKGYNFLMLMNRIGPGKDNWSFPKRPIRITDCSVKDVKTYTLSDKQMKTNDLEGKVLL